MKTIVLLALLACVAFSAIDNCKTPKSGDATKCEACNDNFTLTVDKSKCGASIQGCTELNNTTLTKCATCDTAKNFVLKNELCECNTNFLITQDKKQCGATIADCTALDNTTLTKCSTCAATKMLIQNQTKCVASISNCKLANDTTNTQCAECNTSFSLTPNKLCITSVTECTTYSETECTACKTGFKLSTDKKKCESGSSNGSVISFSVAIVAALAALAL